eukprot:1352114-Rhodomonas_salina.1
MQARPQRTPLRSQTLQLDGNAFRRRWRASCGSSSTVAWTISFSPSPPSSRTSPVAVNAFARLWVRSAASLAVKRGYGTR